ncbi:MAG TPA: thiamine pyrophosphate-dependent enzyme, partial [Mycobacterium sp.]|nr:thiamine pyrophosphate-dependent enzyme [Mycobacterium sp.]
PYLPCTHVHTDNLRASLTMLSFALSGRGRPTGPPVSATGARTELRPPSRPGPGVRYRDAMAVLDTALPRGVDIAVDAGNAGAAAIHHLPARRDGRFLIALGMGGMGYSFGAGIGMAFGRAHRHRTGSARAAGAAGLSRASRTPRTIVIAGDGAFFMHGMEIHTAVQYRLPVTFVLFNNNAHAMCVTREQLYYADRYTYNRFRPSNLGAGLAAMFPGLAAVDVADIDTLAGAVRAALAVAGPSVISVECSADEIPPFAPFLAATDVDHVAQQPVPMREESPDHVTVCA